MDTTLFNKTGCLRNGRNWLLIIFVFLIAAGCEKNSSEVRVLFVGDIMLSRNVKEEITRHRTFPWEQMIPLFHSADLVAGNLEGTVGKVEDQFDPNVKSPVFDIDSSHINLLKQAGFNMITIENNHSFDLGERGRRNTCESLLHKGIRPVSFDNSPQFFTVKGVVISVLALNRVPNRGNSKNKIPSVEVRQKLRLARSLSNVVIVSVHWGSELLDWPNSEQREIARWLIENGADVIIGSHPHLIQKPEMVHGKPVFFSLGNHLFDQKYPDTKEGLIVDIRIDKGKIRCGGIISHTQQNSFYPGISGTIDYQFVPSRFNTAPFTLNQYTIKPVSVIEGRKNNTSLQIFQDGKKIWTAHDLSLVSLCSARLDGEKEYLFSLEKHYSHLDGEISVRPYVYSFDNKALIARWRGSALAWPLLDAQILPHNSKILCVLHRGDSFINPHHKSEFTRVAAYKWNGFGFSGISDTLICNECKKLYIE